MGLDGKKTKMKAADINKVDLVPSGAQQHSRIAIYKADEPEKIDKAGFLVTSLDKMESEPISDFNSEFQELKDEQLKDVIKYELFDYTYALHDALCDIICSDEPNKLELVNGSIDQFSAAISNACSDWCSSEIVSKAGKKISTNRLAKLKEMHGNLGKLIAETDNETKDKSEDKIDNKDVSSDESEYNDTEVKAGCKIKKTENKERSNNMGELINKSALPQEVQDYISNLEAQVAKAEPEQEDIMKGLPEAVVKMLEKSKNESRQLAEQVAKMADENITKEFIAKAESYPMLGVNPAEFGLVLKSIAASNPESYAKLEVILKSANEAIEKGGLFEEYGTSAYGITTAVSKEDAWTQIQDLANARVSKGENSTLAQAIEAVMKTAEGAKLYNIYKGL